MCFRAGNAYIFNVQSALWFCKFLKYGLKSNTSRVVSWVCVVKGKPVTVFIRLFIRNIYSWNWKRIYVYYVIYNKDVWVEDTLSNTYNCAHMTGSHDDMRYIWTLPKWENIYERRLWEFNSACRGLSSTGYLLCSVCFEIGAKKRYKNSMCMENELKNNTEVEIINCNNITDFYNIIFSRLLMRKIL